MSRLFISHASADNAAAAALHLWLGEQGFADVFLDIDAGRGLVPGERWQEALKVATHRCEAVLCLISPAWLTSKWCQAEFLTAKLLHKRIFGLIVALVPRDEVPADMAALEELPGVGHKTASVVLSQAFGQPAFPVDTHIHRLAARWGLSDGSSVART